MQTPNEQHTLRSNKHTAQEIRNRIFALTDITPKRTKERPSKHSENVLHWREVAPYILGATFGGLDLVLANEMVEIRWQNILVLSFKVDLTLKSAIQANASKYNNETIAMKDSFLDMLFEDNNPHGFLHQKTDVVTNENEG